MNTVLYVVLHSADDIFRIISMRVVSFVMLFSCFCHSMSFCYWSYVCLSISIWKKENKLQLSCIYTLLDESDPVDVLCISLVAQLSLFIVYVILGKLHVFINRYCLVPWHKPQGRNKTKSFSIKCRKSNSNHTVPRGASLINIWLTLPSWIWFDRLWLVFVDRLCTASF